MDGLPLLLMLLGIEGEMGVWARELVLVYSFRPAKSVWMGLEEMSVIELEKDGEG